MPAEGDEHLQEPPLKRRKAEAVVANDEEKRKKAKPTRAAIDFFLSFKAECLREKMTGLLHGTWRASLLQKCMATCTNTPI